MTPFENGVGIEAGSRDLGVDDRRAVAAYEDGAERIAAAVENAIQGERGWTNSVSAGLRAGLELLSADPDLARLLAVEPLAASGALRLQHERSLERLAQALRRPSVEESFGAAASDETMRLLAGGIATHVSVRVLAGEAARLPESHELLLEYVLRGR